MEVYASEITNTATKEQYKKDRTASVANTVPNEERMEISNSAYEAPSALELLEERFDGQ